MAYSPYDWHDGPSGATPITAARLNAIEQGIHNAAVVADAASVTLPNGRSVSGPTTLVANDDKVLFNSGTGFSLTLPTASTLTAWYAYTLTNVGSGPVTITNTISGTANRILLQWASIRVYTDGSNFYLG